MHQTDTTVLVLGTSQAMSHHLVHMHKDRNELCQLDKINGHNVDPARSTLLTTQPVEERIHGLTSKGVEQLLAQVRHNELAVGGENPLCDVE